MKTVSRFSLAVTLAGRARFDELLRQAVRTYEPAASGVAAAIPFLADLPLPEILALLSERRQAMIAYQAQVVNALNESPPGTSLVQMAADHFLAMIAAELAWIDRALARLKETGQDGAGKSL